jgi:hypothetical protein
MTLAVGRGHPLLTFLTLMHKKEPFINAMFLFSTILSNYACFVLSFDPLQCGTMGASVGGA